MRVLLVHGRYRSVAPSGENRVVDQEATALSAAGHLRIYRYAIEYPVGGRDVTT